MSPEVDPLEGRNAALQARQELLAGEIESMIGDDTKVTLYSVKPEVDMTWKYRGKRNEIEVFRNRKVRGFSVLDDKREIRMLLGAIASGIRKVDYEFGVASCFLPQHGLTIEKAGKKMDLLICFMCSQGEVYGADKADFFITNNSPLGVFNDTLRAHKLPLPEVSTETKRSDPTASNVEKEVSIEEAFVRSSVVFYGRLSEIHEIRKEVDGYNLQMRVLTFEVKSAYKGVSENRIDVICDSHSGFGEGGYFLIYGEGPHPSYVDETGRSKPAWAANIEVEGKTEFSEVEKLAATK